LFSLDGLLSQVAAPGSGSGVGHAGETPAPAKPAPGKTTTTTAGANLTAGKQVFANNCATCHGATGRGGNGGPDLTTIPSAKQLSVVVKQVTNGGAVMPAFKGQLTSAQINDVAAYVTQKITK
jgi:mono/diheme cytochrome c family protein